MILRPQIQTARLRLFHREHCNSLGAARDKSRPCCSEEKKPQANNQEMISILVGVAVPLSASLILAIVCVVLMRRRLRVVENRNRTSLQPGLQPAGNENASAAEKQEAHQLPDNSVAKHEAETDAGRYELVNDTRPVEVSAVRPFAMNVLS